MPGGRSQFERFAGRTPWKTRWYSTRAARHGKHARVELAQQTMLFLSFPCRYSTRTSFLVEKLALLASQQGKREKEKDREF